MASGLDPPEAAPTSVDWSQADVSAGCVDPDAVTFRGDEKNTKGGYKEVVGRQGVDDAPIEVSEARECSQGDCQHADRENPIERLHKDKGAYQTGA